MKNIYTAFILFFICNPLSAQKADTLFSKNYNDNNLSSASPNSSISYTGGIITLISSKADTSYKINSSACLGINPFASIYSQLLQGTTGSVYDLLKITINNTPVYDTVRTTFNIKTKSFEGNLLNKTNQVAFIAPPSLAPLSAVLNYVGSGDVSIQKIYSFYPSEGLFINSRPYSLMASKSISSAKPERTTVNFNTANQSTTFAFTLSASRPTNSITKVVSSSGNNFMTTDDNLKSSVLTDFCLTANDQASCKSGYNLTYVFNSSLENYDFHSFILDDIYITGSYKSLLDALDIPSNQDKSKKVIKAYNMMGYEVFEFNNYSGLLILVYSDGSKAKVIR